MLWPALALLLVGGAAWLPLREVAADPFPFPPSAPVPRSFFDPLFATPWFALAAHGVAAALFAAILLVRTRSRFLAWTAAALFALHPVATEVLAAPPHRPLAPAMAFFLLAAWALLRRPGRRPRPADALGAALSALFGLALLLPALVAGWRATAAFYAADPAWTLADRFATAPWLFFRSLRCLLVPWPLNVAQPLVPAAPFSTRFWIGMVWTALVVAGAVGLGRLLPELAAALVLLLAAFLPFSGLLPLPHPVADRYLYFMAPGFALAAATVLSRHPSRGARASGAVLLLLLFALLLHLRLPQWRTPESLLAAASFQNPASVSVNRACADLCDALGRPENAALYRAEADRLAAAATTP